MKGVEPSSPGWKPGVMSISLPLYDIRLFVRVTRIELTSPTWKAGVITIIRYPRVLHPGGMVLMLSHFVGEVGNDPTILCV